MISAANAYAAEAGREILRAGGSAIDAAIATQLVLNLVEPQSSGIGGGAFILYWDAARKELKAYDGRETAPASATPDRFLIDGKPMPFADAVRSGLSVGVPGVVRVLELVAQASTASCLGRDCSSRRSASPRRALWCRRACTGLLEAAHAETSRRKRGAISSPPASLPAVGTVLKNPEFAATLRRIAAEGAAGFYTGATAEAIVKAVARSAARAGRHDARRSRRLRRQGAHRRFASPTAPIKSAASDRHRRAVRRSRRRSKCWSRSTSAPDRPPRSIPHALHLIAEAEKLAYADRDRYQGDPDFVAVPVGSARPRSIWRSAASCIDRAAAMATPEPGTAAGARAPVVRRATTTQRERRHEPHLDHRR